MPPLPPPGPEGADLFRNGGENGRLMAAFDWSTTPLGPVPTWPTSLRHTVRTVLASRFPMILAWGPAYTQIYNDAYATLIGAKHPGAIGDDLRVTLAEGWTALQGPVEHAMRAEEPSWIPQLLLLLERAGYREETYFTVSHAPAYGDDGEVAGMHAVCTEVTRQVLAERRQRLLHEVASSAGSLDDERTTASQMCAALAGGALDVPFAAVYLTGDDGRLTRTAVTGCDASLLPGDVGSPAELPGRAVDSLGVLGGPFGDRVCEAEVLVLTGGRDAAPVGALLVGVSPNRALDEEYRSFHALLAGQFAGAVVNARAYAAERSRAESLAALDRAKTAFFADVSHELRTPLTLLLAPVADLLRDGTLPGAAREQLELAGRNGRRLKRLVDDLLEFVRIEGGRATPVRVATDVPALTTELAALLRSAAERAGLRLDVSCPPLPRPAFVDPRMWEKVVVNLVANAVKYTFVGGVTVALRGDGDVFALTVTDTGVGIPAEELPRLFDRFHRVPGAAARSREGSGLGLALVRELVALHGGTVEVASEPGAGSTFTVRMPYGTADAEGAAPAGPSEEATGAAELPWDDARGPADDPVPASAATVLIADDNADMRAYLERLLAPHWRVRTAADGRAALESALAEPPDLVVADVMMPLLDGFELLRELRDAPATRAVPVVVLTARAGQEAAVEGLAAGADDYLAKPFDGPELVARIRVALDRAAGREPRPVPLPPPSAAAAPLPPVPVPPAAVPDPRPPVAVPAEPSAEAVRGHWRFPSTARSIPAVRRRLGALLTDAGLPEDDVYDLVLAACEAATNAIEHAQHPTEPFVEVAAQVTDGVVEVEVRDFGQWRERVPSMDRGRGSALMSAVADITATPSPGGTTVVIRSVRR